MEEELTEQDTHDKSIDELFTVFTNQTATNVEFPSAKNIVLLHRIISEKLNLTDYSGFQLYTQLKLLVSNTIRAKDLFKILDKRAEQSSYEKQRLCRDMTVVVVGAGPVGLRFAIEAALLGAEVHVIEKRTSFTRNNICHLWHFSIDDLKAIGVKKLFGGFCSGNINHISIRRVQCCLLQVCLLYGVKFHAPLEYIDILEPENGHRWRVKLNNSSHPLGNIDVDIVVAADGARTKFRSVFDHVIKPGKQCLGITANFLNHHTKEEREVQSIAGVVSIYDQQFFKNLNFQKEIDLENIVYYKGDTHYFVMTARKKNLIAKNVLIEDKSDLLQICTSSNINFSKLYTYVEEVNDFATGLDLDFYVKKNDQKDVSLFDFSRRAVSVNSTKIFEKYGHSISLALIGDSLIEPFWPLGTGLALGFLAAMDTAWFIRGIAKQEKSPKHLLAEREAMFKLLNSEFNPNHLQKPYSKFSIDPHTRYSSALLSKMIEAKVKQGAADLYVSDKDMVWKGIHQANLSALNSEASSSSNSPKFPPKHSKPTNIHDEMAAKFSNARAQEKEVDDILSQIQFWFKTNLAPRKSNNKDFYSIFQDGHALCSIISRYRPDLMSTHGNINKLTIEERNELVFSIAEEHFDITRMLLASDMKNPDKLALLSYLLQWYNYFKNQQPAAIRSNTTDPSILIKNSLLRKTRRRYGGVKRDTLTRKQSSESMIDSQIANILTPGTTFSSDICRRCEKSILAIEKVSAEGVFFHRTCFQCEFNECKEPLNHNNVSVYHEGNNITFLCGIHFNTITTADQVLGYCTLQRAKDHKEPMTMTAEHLVKTLDRDDQKRRAQSNPSFMDLEASSEVSEPKSGVFSAFKKKSSSEFSSKKKDKKDRHSALVENNADKSMVNKEFKKNQPFLQKSVSPTSGLPFTETKSVPIKNKISSLEMSPINPTNTSIPSDNNHPQLKNTSIKPEANHSPLTKTGIQFDDNKSPFTSSGTKSDNDHSPLTNTSTNNHSPLVKAIQQSLSSLSPLNSPVKSTGTHSTAIPSIRKTSVPDNRTESPQYGYYHPKMESSLASTISDQNKLIKPSFNSPSHTPYKNQNRISSPVLNSEFTNARLTPIHSNREQTKTTVPSSHPYKSPAKSAQVNNIGRSPPKSPSDDSISTNLPNKDTYYGDVRAKLKSTNQSSTNSSFLTTLNDGMNIRNTPSPSIQINDSSINSATTRVTSPQLLGSKYPPSPVLHKPVLGIQSVNSCSDEYSFPIKRINSKTRYPSYSSLVDPQIDINLALDIGPAPTEFRNLRISKAVSTECILRSDNNFRKHFEDPKKRRISCAPLIEFTKPQKGDKINRISQRLSNIDIQIEDPFFKSTSFEGKILLNERNILERELKAIQEENTLVSNVNNKKVPLKDKIKTQEKKIKKAYIPLNDLPPHEKSFTVESSEYDQYRDANKKTSSVEPLLYRHHNLLSITDEEGPSISRRRAITGQDSVYRSRRQFDRNVCRRAVEKPVDKSLPKSKISVFKQFFNQFHEDDDVDSEERQRITDEQMREQETFRRAIEIDEEIDLLHQKMKHLEDKGKHYEQRLRNGNLNEKDSVKYLKEWSFIINERNKLLRQERDLSLEHKEYQLRDELCRVENELRKRQDRDSQFSGVESKALLNEKFQLINEMDELVQLIESERLQEMEEDKYRNSILGNVFNNWETIDNGLFMTGAEIINWP